MLGLHYLDWLVIFAYLIGTTMIGVWACRRVKSAASFFISDRKFGKVMMMFFTFGAGTQADQAVSVAAKTYRVGASGIWYQWLWLFVTPFFWLIAPLFRRMRAVTTAEFYEARFDRGIGVLFALMGILQMMVTIGLVLKGSTAIVTSVSGGAINPTLAVWAMTAMFVAYGLAGGLNAAIITDFIQGMLTIVFSFLLLPFAFSEVHGMSGLREMVGRPEMFRFVAPGEINPFYIFIISLNGLIGWVTAPHSMGTAAAGKTEMECRVGVMCGIIFKRVCTIAWTLTGLCAVALYMGKTINIDQVYGLMAHDLLPKVGPGLIGLFIAATLASVMSACGACMVSSAALFTVNIYKPLLVKNREDKHYTLVGRICVVAVVLFGIFFAFEFESVVQGLEILWEVAALMGIAFWVGLFWRRATSAGAWASTLISFAVLLLTSKLTCMGHVFWDFNARCAGALPAFMLWDGALYLPWQMILYLGAGFVALVAVSLVTKPVSKERLDDFYECIRTPIQPGETEIGPFTLPPGTVPAPRRTFIKHPDFEIPIPERVTVIGFIWGWIAVALLLVSFYWILSLGKA